MDWLLPTVVGVAIALVGIIWKMLNAKIDREVSALWDQVGRDTNSGMRPAVHDIANIRAGMNGIDARITRLETWRNGKP